MKAKSDQQYKLAQNLKYLKIRRDFYKYPNHITITMFDDLSGKLASIDVEISDLQSQLEALEA